MRGAAQVEPFGDKVIEARLRWLGHIQMREGGYVGQRMIKMELPGRKKRGRPERRLNDVAEDMQIVGVTEEDVGTG